jgi:hypothetical protein
MDGTCCEALSTMLSPSTLPPPLSKHVGFVILMGGSAPGKNNLEPKSAVTLELNTFTWFVIGSFHPRNGGLELRDVSDDQLHCYSFPLSYTLRPPTFSWLACLFQAYQASSPIRWRFVAHSPADIPSTNQYAYDVWRE